MPIPLGGDYEVDELCTYCGNRTRRVWVAYALERSSRRVVALGVGPRTKRVLGVIITTLLNGGARRITTDGLELYRSLVPRGLHRVKRFGINRIERHNLVLRTRLKRLARRTLCNQAAGYVGGVRARCGVWVNFQMCTIFNTLTTAGPLSHQRITSARGHDEEARHHRCGGG